MILFDEKISNQWFLFDVIVELEAFFNRQQGWQKPRTAIDSGV